MLVQRARAAPTGGDSFAIDAYAFTEGLVAADPALLYFLSGSDVDLYGAWAGVSGLRATPRVARHIGYTVREHGCYPWPDGAVPMYRHPAEDHMSAMLHRFQDAVHALELRLPRFRLAETVILVDNYPCWRGRDPHTGERTVRILTLLTADAC
ncbi:hypothetical protein GCM10010377_54970 [Streptomyces viridiviolaceus]|uniref:Uncharacterized protein n=1 Tax=Streptomyces viridiviolaceus TaxID=68282 RepID=A0ABW2E8C8_9ACTN|nr:hypothetical protein [Streptomyces viridiviolaceus]GHB56929.1 hypothetical protein GCM10010377_54970 [Streptomyces viridiviolaceus]